MKTKSYEARHYAFCLHSVVTSSSLFQATVHFSKFHHTSRNSLSRCKIYRDINTRQFSKGNSIFKTVNIKITPFLDSFHRPVFKRPENTMFRKLDLLPSSGDSGQ
jgi:hypothetical protein